MDARSQHDYIALSRLFHTVMLFDVPVMTAQLESEARRFIALVDEFYERHVKLGGQRAVPLYDIYQGERLKFEFQRCLFASAGDAERRVPQTSAYALTGDFFRRIQGRKAAPGAA
ncbi:ATPase [Klebsiella pneumoniae]|uniref:ATPase n=1 Tax=Klebsiella pneumoniae TaxID=573 RepID=A0A3S4HT80_KLEPN|nr:ATPase [Klebsiella pneumoniae]